MASIIISGTTSGLHSDNRPLNVVQCVESLRDAFSKCAYIVESLEIRRRRNSGVVREGNDEDTRNDHVSTSKRRKVSIPRDIQGITDSSLPQPSPCASGYNKHSDEDDGMSNIPLEAGSQRTVHRDS